MKKGGAGVGTFSFENGRRCAVPCACANAPRHQTSNTNQPVMHQHYPTHAKSNPLKRLFFWLSGASNEGLEACPTWEQRKYVAFGATVLVPTVFAFIACAYALSTLTNDWRVILPVSAVWSFIILTIDRALLATYRSFQPIHRKLGQFFLRFVVAMLMGLTISHPLTLLLFKDTIHSVIEEERETEIEGVRKLAAVNKTEVEDRLTALDDEIATQRTAWNETFNAEFLVEAEQQADLKDGLELTADETAELQQQITDGTAAQQTRIAAIDAETEKLQPDYQKLQGELDFWQREFEREVNGQRSGIVGLGPRARSIRDDQLEWRRAETKRLSDLLEALTTERNQLRAVMTTSEEAITSRFLAALAEKADLEKAEHARVAALRQQVQAEQAGSFVEQQNAMRGSIKTQIDTRLEELGRLQGELAKVADDERSRIAAIAAEPRRDILTQTLALHDLFLSGGDGGHFALIAYLVLALLFMLVDTIPIIVKFFSKPGPYDTLVDCEEVRFDKERKAFLESYDEYMAELSESRLLTATKNQPLERALIEGVDRSRVAKEFMESLMELERSFEERMAQERQRLITEAGGGRGHSAMLEEMAQTFYQDLRNRMEAFFQSEPAARLSHV